MQAVQKRIVHYCNPYPRPFPCGSLVLGFDRRKMELIGHQVFLEVFTDMHEDKLWVHLKPKHAIVYSKGMLWLAHHLFK